MGSKTPYSWSSATMNGAQSPILDPLWEGSRISRTHRCECRVLVSPLHTRIQENEHAMEAHIISSTQEIESDNDFTESDAFILLRLPCTTLDWIPAPRENYQFNTILQYSDETMQNNQKQTASFSHTTSDPSPRQCPPICLLWNPDNLKQIQNVRTTGTAQIFHPVTFTFSGHLRERYRGNVSFRTMKWRKLCYFFKNRPQSFYCKGIDLLRKQRDVCYNAHGDFLWFPIKAFSIQLVHFSFGQYLDHHCSYDC